MPFFDVNDELTKVEYLSGKIDETILFLITNGSITPQDGWSDRVRDYLIKYLLTQFDEIAYNEAELLRVIGMFVMGFQWGIKESMERIQKLVREGKINFQYIHD